MIELDPSAFPTEIAAVLLRRGAECPQLNWAAYPDKMSKRTLDEIEDQRLFGGKPPADEGMGAAVRALLYLWSGCPDDAKMLAPSVPDSERHYINALCERQLGDVVAAKEALQQLDGHAIYAPLAAHVRGHVKDCGDALLKRFMDMLAMTEEWEPFAFADLWEQGAEGKLTSGAEQAARALQCREFELLLVHCYQAATGEKLRARPVERPTQPRRPRPQTRKPAPRRVSERPEPASRSAKEVESADEKKKDAVKTVGVACPKCASALLVHEEQRGTAVKCGSCAAVFMVPRQQGARQPI